MTQYDPISSHFEKMSSAV